MKIDYVQALKDAFVRDRGNSYKVYVGLKTDEQYCKTLGIPTWWLKFDHQLTTPQHRRALIKLEKEGKVISYLHSKNNRFWWPVGFSDELVKNCKSATPYPQSVGK